MTNSTTCLTKLSPESTAGPFESDADVRRIATGLLDRSLPKRDWTHAAHCAATICLYREHPDLDLPKDLPGLIKRYNEATGVENTDDSGYHETITQFYLTVIRRFLNSADKALSLVDTVNLFVSSPCGRRDFPLQYYSKERLFSTEARRSFLQPDLRRL